MDIRLNDGTLLEVKFNFYAQNMIAQRKIGLQQMVLEMKKKELKKCKSEMQRYKLEAIVQAMEMDIVAELVYIIMRSNGLKVDKEEAQILCPANPKEIELLFKELGKKIEESKKK